MPRLRLRACLYEYWHVLACILPSCHKPGVVPSCTCLYLHMAESGSCTHCWNLGAVDHQQPVLHLPPSASSPPSAAADPWRAVPAPVLRALRQENFADCFKKQYMVIHRLETNKLRNVASLFAHLLATDAISWCALPARCTLLRSRC